MGVDTNSWITSIIGYAITGIGTLITTTWLAARKLSGLETDADKKIADVKDEVLRSIGETVAALRQKAVDMELWGRDNFVRRQEFQTAIDGFARSIESLRVEINAGYQRLTDKMDRIIRSDLEK